MCISQLLTLHNPSNPRIGRQLPSALDKNLSTYVRYWPTLKVNTYKRPDNLRVEAIPVATVDCKKDSRERIAPVEGINGVNGAMVQ